MSKVIVTDHNFVSLDPTRDILGPAGFELEEIQPICKTEDDVIRRCGDAGVLLVQWAPVTRRVLQSLPRVKCVVRYGIGVDNIDLDAATELGVIVANVPRYCVEEVSNHTLAMILSLGRRIPQNHNQVMRGGWGINPFRPIPAFSDMRLGLVGFGAIGQRVAEKARAFRFQVMAFDPYAPDSVFAEGEAVRVDWATLVKNADVISLHCPLTPETRHLINHETIAAMKPGVCLINTARGPLVNEADLIEALTDGRIGEAGLDVFEEEPLPLRSPLRAFSNVILTSHSASVSEGATRILQCEAAAAARDFLQGKRPAAAL